MTEFRERVFRYVEAHDGAELEQIEAAIPALTGAVAGALRQLARDGRIDKRTVYRVKPYPLSRRDS